MEQFGGNDGFFQIIVGPVASGKTSLLIKMLTDPTLYGEKFQYVFVISPTGNKLGLKLPPGRFSKKLDIRWLKEKVEELNTAHSNKAEPPIEVLFVIDDQIGMVKKLEFDEFFTSFIFNRRHLLNNGIISVVITTQKYTMLPARFRSNANKVTFFQLNKNDLKLIWEELLTIPKEVFITLLRQVFPPDIASRNTFTIDLANKKLLDQNFIPMDFVIPEITF